MDEERLWVIDGLNPVPWKSSQTGGKNHYKPESLRVYQKAVADEFRALYHGPPIEGRLHIEFYFWREVQNQEQRGSRGSDNVADATNLQKSTEDALQGVLFANDRMVHDIRSRIEEQGEGVHPRIVIRLLPWEHGLPETVGRAIAESGGADRDPARATAGNIRDRKDVPF